MSSTARTGRRVRLAGGLVLPVAVALSGFTVPAVASGGGGVLPAPGADAVSDAPRGATVATTGDVVAFGGRAGGDTSVAAAVGEPAGGGRAEPGDGPVAQAAYAPTAPQPLRADRAAGSAPAGPCARPRAGASPEHGHGCPGPAGPKGPRGEKGEKGGSGPKGDAGPPGPRGEPGVKGSAGPKGDVGPPGLKGEPGGRGSAGPKGDVGPPGLKGEPGGRGSAGPKGDVGPVGAKGEPGERGSVGPKGERGSVGGKGERGAVGRKGDPGPKGDPGRTGDVGAAGPQGQQGPAGPAGPAGAQGLPGLPGTAGPQGFAGPPGRQGGQGPAGPAGAQGLPGPLGPRGVPGPTGPCASVDNQMPNNSEEFALVLKDGKTYLGRRTRDMAGQWGEFAWTDLTVAPVTGYPADVCTVALAIHGNDVKIKAITKTGTLYHTHCATNGRAVTCDSPWAPVHPQPGAVPPPAARTLHRDPARA